MSFFDYHEFGSEKWKEYAFKCLPTLVLRNKDSMSILFLDSGEFGRLVSWENWKWDGELSLHVVPHVEVGYPGLNS